MNYSNIVQQNLEQQVLQQQIQQQQEQMLRDQQLRQQMEQQILQQQQAQAGGQEEEYWIIFDQAVQRIFKEWTALQLAIANEWGGRSTKERAEDMRQDILDLFAPGKPVYSDQIEKVLDECLSQDLNTVAEDDSYKQVAAMIIQCYNLCVNGQYNEIVALLGPETVSVISNCVKGAGNDSDDEVDGGDTSEMGDDDDEMMDDDDEMGDNNNQNDKPKKYSEPDDEGWVTVGTGKRR